MKEYKYVTLRQRPELKDRAAEWFHYKWGVPQEAYPSYGLKKERPRDTSHKEVSLVAF